MSSTSRFLLLILTFSVICFFLGIPMSSSRTLLRHLKDSKRSALRRDRRASEENASINTTSRATLVGSPYEFLDRNVSLKSSVIIGPVNPTPAKDQIRPNDEIICSTTTITSFVDNFKALRNCTVIEGKLVIGPIDFPEKLFEEISFPHLREINDYLLVYRVTGLKTLRNIFPNLAVIRGKQMFKGNSLVIFENPDMEDLGLISLTYIQRGGIWITKNPVLCYLDTLAWKKVLVEEWAKVYHKENRPEDQCVNQCPGNCRKFFSIVHRQERPMCWTTNDCQHAPFLTCTAGQQDCCHSLCMTGCFGAERNECLVCNNVQFNGACYQTCPAFTYEVRGRRCVSEEVCRNFSLDGYARDFKAHEGQCRRDCPANFMTNPLDVHQCIPCSGPCPKSCRSATVTTFDTAEKLRQCTIINGSLEIQVGKGEQIIATLEQTLQNIEHVTDYIKIIRSHALLSLSFFKRLRFIGGVNTAPGGYALMVIDNQNLQDLFSFSTDRPTLQIGNTSAKVAFHFNPRLCLSKIDALMNQISVGQNKTYDPRDISTTSNGDRVACDISHLNLQVGDRDAEGVMLRWDVFEMPDPRSLLGYVLYYRESPAQNLSKYEGREACSGDTWQQIDLPPHDEGDRDILHALYPLAPARQYGVYVSTYTIASERQGAQSAIVYFSTLSKQPSKPVAVTTESVSSSEIRVYWQPPAEPNGQINHYNVRWQRLIRFDHRLKLRERDYCQNAIVPSRQYFQPSATTPPSSLTGTCACNGTKEAVDVRIPAGRTPEEHEEYITMENAIQDLVFQKRRDKRDVSAVASATDTTPATLGFIDSSTVTASWHNNTDTDNVTIPVEMAIDVTSGNVTTKPKPKPTPPISNETIHQRQVEGVTTYTIKDLLHFTDYVIWVEACHSDEAAQTNVNGNIEAGKFRYPSCSQGANANPSQTLALHGADNIPSESVTADLVKRQTDSGTVDVVQITWKDPAGPNGVIVRVDVEYLSAERPTPKSECVPRTKPGNEQPWHTLDFHTMPSGNYSFRLRASSFAGNGSWTEAVFLQFERPETAPPGYSPQTVAGIVCGCLLIVVMVGIASFCIWKKHFKKDIPAQPNQVSVNPDYYAYTPDEWEVPRENIELVKELGMGSFGKVYLGIAKNILAGVDRLEVAIKTVNEDKSMSEKSYFLQEASIMKEFRCAHVVKLLGVVSEGSPALVIMELMGNGDLKTYLRNQRPDEEHPDRTPPLFSRILQMAGEICDGMAYIHSRKFVHRDLAARNCMIADDLTVKIGDFGMTRDVYETDYYRKGGKGLLPVRWMAPEALKDGLFTNESDVWSFGVVLWEIATLAAQPYQGLSNEQTLKFVIDGNVMDRPEGCPDMLYDIMKKCWQRIGKDRPTFLQIINELLPNLNDKFREGGESYFATVDMDEVLRTPTHHDSEADMPSGAVGEAASPSSGRVLSIRVKNDETDDEAESGETDTLLNSTGRYVEPQVIVQQNGGSTVSSADNSKAMVLTYPNAVASASVTSDGSIGKTLGNGGASQTSLSARTVY